MYGHQLGPTTTPPCGLDLQYEDSTAKISFSGQGQVIFRDLAIVDNHSGECPSSGTPPNYPFFFISGTVVHFENVSIQGEGQRLHACNDAFVLGNSTNTFTGWGSTFHNLYFSYVRRIALLGPDANGTDWDSISTDDNSGNSSDGTHPDQSAIEINCTSGHPCYGNTFKDIAVEQGYGMSFTQNYKYALDVIAYAGPNYVFGITCSDGPDLTWCAHIGSTSVDPQMVLGCHTRADSSLDYEGCVLRDNISNYVDIVADPYKQSFFARNMYGTNLGQAAEPFNNLYLAVNLSLAAAGYVSAIEGTPATTCAVGTDFLWADSTASRWKMCNHNGSAVQVVGSGSDIDTSDHVSATHLSSPLPTTQGGTGMDSSSSTGVAQVSSGTWSVSAALASGTTATTQSVGDNSTKVATTAYADAARFVIIYFFSATNTTAATYFSVGTNDTAESNVQYPMDQNGTITSMTCRTVVAQGSGKMAVLDLEKNGALCNLEVSWSNANTTQTDGSHSCGFSTTDLLDMKLSTSISPPAGTQYMCTLTGHR
jgi:hypothetical protein